MEMQWLFDRFVAHRGYHNEQHQENTMDAFRRAIDCGYNIELDVQPTRDGVPVVFHDTNLKRLTGRDLYIREITYRDLKDNVRYLGTQTGIPTFEEVLRLCEGKTGLMIEVKKDDYLTEDTDIERIVVPMLKTYGGEFVVKSFNPHSVRHIQDVAPEFCTGLLCAESDIESYSIRVRKLVDELLFGERCVDFFDVAVNLLESPLACAVRARNMPVVTWTVRDQATYDNKHSLFSTMIFENFEPHACQTRELPQDKRDCAFAQQAGSIA